MSAVAVLAAATYDHPRGWDGPLGIMLGLFAFGVLWVVAERRKNLSADHSPPPPAEGGQTGKRQVKPGSRRSDPDSDPGPYVIDYGTHIVEPSANRVPVRIYRPGQVEQPEPEVRDLHAWFTRLLNGGTRMGHNDLIRAGMDASGRSWATVKRALRDVRDERRASAAGPTPLVDDPEDDFDDLDDLGDDIDEDGSPL